MENRAHAIATGLFALLLGGALVLALWWFSEDREATREYLLASTGSVNGLNVQAAVRYRGMLAGRVTDIAIDPQDARRLLVKSASGQTCPSPVAPGPRWVLKG